MLNVRSLKFAACLLIGVAGANPARADKIAARFDRPTSQLETPEFIELRQRLQTADAEIERLRQFNHMQQASWQQSGEAGGGGVRLCLFDTEQFDGRRWPQYRMVPAVINPHAPRRKP